MLAVLVADRQRSVVRDLALVRRAGLRRSLAFAILAIGAGFTALGDLLDEEPAPIVNPARVRGR
ncbi:MAG: hypothetical protein NVS3B7_02860 [Candidatus Elarobacter sp.]